MRSSGGNVDSIIVRSNRASASTTTVPEDLVSQPRSWAFTASPPRNFLSQIHWAQLTYDSNTSLSTTTPTEANVTIQLSQFNGASSLASVFDQYACYCFTTTVTLLNTSAGFNVNCWTALDYDNVSNIGVSGIEQYSTCTLTVLNATGASSVQRFVKPCVDGTIFGGYSASRYWLDSGSTGTNYYGIRVILGPGGSGSNLVEISTKAIFAFRSVF